MLQSPPINTPSNFTISSHHHLTFSPHHSLPYKSPSNFLPFWGKEKPILGLKEVNRLGVKNVQPSFYPKNFLPWVKRIFFGYKKNQI